MINSVPYWRLSFFYAAYFACVGGWVPYLGLYLQSLGYGAQAIGQFTFVLMAGRIIAPAVWGHWADRDGRRLRIVRITVLLTALAFVPFYRLQSFAEIMFCLAVFGFFWSAALPQFEAITLNFLAQREAHYPRVRVWGSIGFIVTAVALGRWYESQPISQFPLVVMALVLLIALAGWLVPDRAPDPLAGGKYHAAAGASSTLRQQLRQPGVLAFFAACLLLQLSFGPYYAFYTIYLEAHGYARPLIGKLWGLGVLAEVLLFLFMHRLLPTITLKTLLLLSLLAGALRWVLLAHGVDSLGVLIFAQLLHALTFGAHHVAAIQLVHRYFTGKYQGRGQALYSSVAYGIGGAFGMLLGGYAWERIGAHNTLLACAALCVLALVMAWRYLEPAPPQAALPASGSEGSPLP